PLRDVVLKGDRRFKRIVTEGVENGRERLLADDRTLARHLDDRWPHIGAADGNTRGDRLAAVDAAAFVLRAAERRRHAVARGMVDQRSDQRLRLARIADRQA